MSYRQHLLKLDTAFGADERKQLISRDQQLDEVVIPKMPGGGITIILYFGPDGDPIEVDAPISFQPTGAESRAGLFWSNPAVNAGTTVKLITASSGVRGGLSTDVR